MKLNKTYWTLEEQEFFSQQQIAEIAKLKFKTFQRWSKIIGIHYGRGLIHKSRLPEILNELYEYGKNKAKKGVREPPHLD